MTSAGRLPAEVTTERLTMREWALDDVDALARAVNESLDHLRPFMAWAALEPLPRNERTALIDGWHAESSSGDDVVYGVFLDGTPIGGTGLHRRLGPRTLEIGYWIHVDHLRQGYATELTRGLTTAAFGYPGIACVGIHHDEANTASADVPRKLGFTLVRKQPREPTAPAETGIEWQWAMRKADWV